MTRERACDPHTAILRSRVPHAKAGKSFAVDRARKAPAPPPATLTTMTSRSAPRRGRTAPKQPLKPRKLTVREIAAKVKAEAAPVPLRVVVSRDAVLEKLVAVATPKAQPASPAIQAFGRAISATQSFLMDLGDDDVSRKLGAAFNSIGGIHQARIPAAYPAVALVAVLYVAVLAQAVQ